MSCHWNDCPHGSECVHALPDWIDEIDDKGYVELDINDPVVQARLEEARAKRPWLHLSTPVNTTEVQDGLDIQGRSDH